MPATPAVAPTKPEAAPANPAAAPSKSAAAPANPAAAPSKSAASKPGRAAASTLADRVAALPEPRGEIMVELRAPQLVRGDGRDGCVVVNRNGKRASFRIFEAAAVKHGGVFGPAAAKDALEVYGDVCNEAMTTPGLHPSIDWLLDVVETGQTYVAKIDGKYLAYEGV